MLTGHIWGSCESPGPLPCLLLLLLLLLLIVKLCFLLILLLLQRVAAKGPSCGVQHRRPACNRTQQVTHPGLWQHPHNAAG
jgi:hypothetical protein